MSDLTFIKRAYRNQERVVILAGSELGRKWIIQNIVLDAGFDVDNFECVSILADSTDVEEFIKRAAEDQLTTEVS